MIWVTELYSTNFLSNKTLSRKNAEELFCQAISIAFYIQTYKHILERKSDNMKKGGVLENILVQHTGCLRDAQVWVRMA